MKKAKAFPLRGRPRAASLAPSGQFTFRWRAAPDEMEERREFAGSSCKPQHFPARLISLAFSNQTFNPQDGDLFYNAVKYVYDNGTMNDVSDDKLAPNSTLTRAMVVTILYRMDGEPSARYNALFSDVTNYQWYT